jgi:hypothetical protein
MDESQNSSFALRRVIFGIAGVIVSIGLVVGAAVLLFALTMNVMFGGHEDNRRRAIEEQMRHRTAVAQRSQRLIDGFATLPPRLDASGFEYVDSRWAMYTTTLALPLDVSGITPEDRPDRYVYTLTLRGDGITVTQRGTLWRSGNGAGWLDTPSRDLAVGGRTFSTSDRWHVPVRPDHAHGTAMLPVHLAIPHESVKLINDIEFKLAATSNRLNPESPHSHGHLLVSAVRAPLAAPDMWPPPSTAELRDAALSPRRTFWASESLFDASGIRPMEMFGSQIGFVRDPAGVLMALITTTSQFRAQQGSLPVELYAQLIAHDPYGISPTPYFFDQRTQRSVLFGAILIQSRNDLTWRSADGTAVASEAGPQRWGIYDGDAFVLRMPVDEAHAARIIGFRDMHRRCRVWRLIERRLLKMFLERRRSVNCIKPRVNRIRFGRNTACGCCRRAYRALGWMACVGLPQRC